MVPCRDRATATRRRPRTASSRRLQPEPPPPPPYLYSILSIPPNPPPNDPIKPYHTQSPVPNTHNRWQFAHMSCLVPRGLVIIPAVTPRGMVPPQGDTRLRRVGKRDDDSSHFLFHICADALKGPCCGASSNDRWRSRLARRLRATRLKSSKSPKPASITASRCSRSLARKHCALSALKVAN